MELRKVERDISLQGSKRQYLPYLLEWECPECGGKNTTDFRQNYISYPVWGEETTVPLFCNRCEHFEPTIEVSVVPDISLEVEENE